MGVINVLPEFNTPLQHGGALDKAIKRYGGRAEDWLDSSTGINPVPYPIPEIAGPIWSRLPDASQQKKTHQYSQ